MKKTIISFSLDGISLALDIPMKPNLKRVINRLDKIVISKNGKIYLLQIIF